MRPRSSHAIMRATRHLNPPSHLLAQRLAPSRWRPGTRFLHNIIPRAPTARGPTLTPKITPAPLPTLTPSCSPHRYASTSTSAATATATPTADALMETLTDLYSTAKDEFEIAAEETEKKSTYGEEDRAAAHEAFDALRQAYDAAVAGSGGEVGKEVERRVGPRIRELEAAISNMDEMALED